jgi:hypothetical protein
VTKNNSSTFSSKSITWVLSNNNTENPCSTNQPAQDHILHHLLLIQNSNIPQATKTWLWVLLLLLLLSSQTFFLLILKKNTKIDPKLIK